MRYFCTCDCGDDISVEAAQAGATIECRCGRQVKVPNLSTLRVAAGQGEFESGVADTVVRKIGAGELPSANGCLLCGQPTDHRLVVSVQCERSWLASIQPDGNDGSRGLGVFAAALLSLVSGPLVFLFWWMAWFGDSPGPEESEVVRMGRDTVIDLPLVLDASCQESLNGPLGKWRLKRLIRREPDYDELLNVYRGSKITKTRSA